MAAPAPSAPAASASEPERDGFREHRDLLAKVDALLPDLARIGDGVCGALADGGHVYTFGNGGSAADAQHLAAELVGRFRRDRRPLPAVALSTDPSVVTCIANDYGYEDIFGRQVAALARKGDVVIGFTTSGRSPNVTNGLAEARRAGATTVLFTGGDGGDAIGESDLALVVPSSSTARIQEIHLLMLHLLSERVDRWAAGEGGSSEADAGALTEAAATTPTKTSAQP
jgi:D-sedoheptulose 7-phosphate isomerase